MRIRTASVDDAAAIAEIYNQGIEDRVATYETEPRSAEDQVAWLQAIAGRYPAVVAQIDGEIIGWAGAGPRRRKAASSPGRGSFSRRLVIRKSSATVRACHRSLLPKRTGRTGKNASRKQ